MTGDNYMIKALSLESCETIKFELSAAPKKSTASGLQFWPYPLFLVELDEEDPVWWISMVILNIFFKEANSGANAVPLSPR